MALAHVQESLEPFTRQLKLTTNLSLLDHAWTSEVGRLSSMARIVALDGAALVVEVDAAPVMQELTLRRTELVRRINKYFVSPFIQTMTLRITKV